MNLNENRGRKLYGSKSGDFAQRRINKQFIDNQKALNKKFYLSHDYREYYTSGYMREIDYFTTPISEGGLGGSISDVVINGKALQKVKF